jgi:hypothetical protein
MYKIGEKVVICLDGFKDEYCEEYIIADKRKTYEGNYIYKLRGVPDWGLESMIEYPRTTNIWSINQEEDK